MRRFVGTAALAAFLAVVVAFSLQLRDAIAASADGDSGKGIVYIIRGGLNVFSAGMNDIAATLRESGVDARTLGQATWRDAALEAAERFKTRKEPIVLVGHSFGANAAVLAAEQIGESGIPVALVVLFDPTEPLKAPLNVARVINFLSLDSTGMDFNVWATPKFTGKFENVVLPDLNHISIDDDTDLQQRTVDVILKLFGGGTRASAR